MKLAKVIHYNFEDLSEENIVAELSEVIVAVKYLSKYGSSDVEESIKALQHIKGQNLRAVVEWDRLVDEGDFARQLEIFEQIPRDLIDAVRIQDIGLATYLKEQNFSIQLVVEHNSHNLRALKTLEEFFGNHLERLVLSTEIPARKLISYREELKCELEILGLGKILLFYSPRKLLSPRLGGEKVALAKSEESVHRDFKLVESESGTLMFHHKDFFILHLLESFATMEKMLIRIDCRFLPDQQLRKKIIELGEDFSKNDYPFQTTQGLFLNNRSDVLFKKLKNENLHVEEEERENFIGEVIAVEKNHHLVISLKQKELKRGDWVELRNPEGESKRLMIRKIQSLFGVDSDSAEKNQVCLIDYTKGITAKSLIFSSSQI